MRSTFLSAFTALLSLSLLVLLSLSPLCLSLVSYQAVCTTAHVDAAVNADFGLLALATLVLLDSCRVVGIGTHRVRRLLSFGPGRSGAGMLDRAAVRGACGERGHRVCVCVCVCVCGGSLWKDIGKRAKVGGCV